MDLSFGIAFLAGLASTLSPCIVPVLPTFLVWVTGVAHADAHHRGRILDRIAWFSGGLVLTFTASGVLVGWVGSALRFSGWVEMVAGVLFVLWGLALLGVFTIRAPRIRLPKKHHASRLGAVLFGLLFTLTWSPCIGPIYGTILTLAGATGTALQGGSLLFVYGLGLAIPFLLLGAATERTLHLLRRLTHLEHVFRRVAGVLVIGIGVLMTTGMYTTLITKLDALFPGYTPPIA